MSDLIYAAVRSYPNDSARASGVGLYVYPPLEKASSHRGGISVPLATHDPGNPNNEHDGGTGVWSDGEFIFLACGEGGMHTYTAEQDVNSSNYGALTHIDSDNPGDKFWDVWGDDRFVYAVNLLGGLHVYSIESRDPNNPAYGKLMHMDNHQLTSSNPKVLATGVWSDGHFIYVAYGAAGLHVYTVDDDVNSSTYGALTPMDFHTPTHPAAGDHDPAHLQSFGARNIWSDETFIYLAYDHEGTYVYTIERDVNSPDYGTLTYRYSNLVMASSASATYHHGFPAGYVTSTWGDGHFIYATNAYGGLISFDVQKSSAAVNFGSLTLIDYKHGLHDPAGYPAETPHWSARSSDNLWAMQKGHPWRIWGDKRNVNAPADRLSTFLYVSHDYLGFSTYEVKTDGTIHVLDWDLFGTDGNAGWPYPIANPQNTWLVAENIFTAAVAPLSGTSSSLSSSSSSSSSTATTSSSTVTTSSGSSSSSATIVDPVTVILHPGQYCLVQDFEVLPFFSAPWDVTPMNEMVLLQGTSSGGSSSSISSYINTTCQSPTLASDSLSAIYKVPRPRTDIISLRVPRVYQASEVEHRWLILDEPNCMTIPIHTHENMPGPNADHSTHKYYFILRPVGVSLCSNDSLSSITWISSSSSSSSTSSSSRSSSSFSSSSSSSSFSSASPPSSYRAASGTSWYPQWAFCHTFSSAGITITGNTNTGTIPWAVGHMFKLENLQVWDVHDLALPYPPCVLLPSGTWGPSGEYARGCWPSITSSRCGYVNGYPPPYPIPVQAAGYTASGVAQPDGGCALNYPEQCITSLRYKLNVTPPAGTGGTFTFTKAELEAGIQLDQLPSCSAVHHCTYEQFHVGLKTYGDITWDVPCEFAFRYPWLSSHLCSASSSSGIVWGDPRGRFAGKVTYLNQEIGMPHYEPCWAPLPVWFNSWKIGSPLAPALACPAETGGAICSGLEMRTRPAYFTQFAIPGSNWLKASGTAGDYVLKVKQTTTAGWWAAGGGAFDYQQYRNTVPMGNLIGADGWPIGMIVKLFIQVAYNQSGTLSPWVTIHNKPVPYGVSEVDAMHATCDPLTTHWYWYLRAWTEWTCLYTGTTGFTGTPQTGGWNFYDWVNIENTLNHICPEEVTMSGFQFQTQINGTYVTASTWTGNIRRWNHSANNGLTLEYDLVEGRWEVNSIAMNPNLNPLAFNMNSTLPLADIRNPCDLNTAWEENTYPQGNQSHPWTYMSGSGTISC